MSAYQVHRDTIDLLVSAAIDGLGDRHSRGITVYVKDAKQIHDEELRNAATPVSYDTIKHLGIADGLADALGRELIAANIVSLAARYQDVAAALDTQGWRGDDNPMVGYWPEDYTWKRVVIGTHDGAHEIATLKDVLGALACYDYQSSEAGDYDQSTAGIVTDAIRHKVILRITDTWEWTRNQGAERLAEIRRGER
jgi:hypothetical protein